MLDTIRAFFDRTMSKTADESAEAGASAQPEARVAACALLLELAYADDEFSDTERAHLESAVERHFGLSSETARELIELADHERRKAVDLFQFTALVSREYDAAQKMVLLEVMWGLVYADGVVAKHETYLMKKVSKLLDVQPGFLAEARRRAEKG
jgi:uncharacterized tellurite resistance protein B-like protein